MRAKSATMHFHSPLPLLASHLAPTKNEEAALEVSLPPGAYPAILSGHGNPGFGIVEIHNKQ